MSAIARRPFPARQRGVVLLFALVVMVALALAAVALVRSTGTGTSIMGAIAFKHDATGAAATGAEQAIRWLQDNTAGNVLEGDRESAGYYASSLERLDPTGNRSGVAPVLLAGWDDRCASGGSATTICYRSSDPITVNGNQVQWIITRLCAGPGPAGGVNSCAMPVDAGTTFVNDRGQVGQDGRIKDVSTSPYFRIVVRVAGPRQTTSITEQLVHF